MIWQLKNLLKSDPKVFLIWRLMEYSVSLARNQ